MKTITCRNHPGMTCAEVHLDDEMKIKASESEITSLKLRYAELEEATGRTGKKNLELQDEIKKLKRENALPHLDEWKQFLAEKAALKQENESLLGEIEKLKEEIQRLEEINQGLGNSFFKELRDSEMKIESLQSQLKTGGKKH